MQEIRREDSSDNITEHEGEHEGGETVAMEMEIEKCFFLPWLFFSLYWLGTVGYFAP
jgi:hypothetical protein